MGVVRRVEEIKGWQKARVLVKEVYEVCRVTSLKRDFALRDQLCRAATSSMSNIAEGFGRRTDRDFAHFLDMANGSACEVQSLLYVALDAGHLSETRFQELYQLADETIRLITAFAKYLRNPTPDSGLQTPDYGS